MNIRKLPTVTDCSMNVDESQPRILTLAATGTAPTTGWTACNLIPYEYFNPPENGLLDFDLVAMAPEIIALGAPPKRPYVYTSNLWRGEIPEWVIGLRIHGAENSMQALLGESKFQAKVLDRSIPFPLKIEPFDRSTPFPLATVSHNTAEPIRILVENTTDHETNAKTEN
jgi:hypothetical protein